MRPVKFILILLLCIFCHAVYGQVEDWPRPCLEHGGTPPDPKKGGSCPDAGPCGYCPTCKSLRDEQYRKYKAQEEKRLKDRQERYEKQLQAKADADAQKKKDLEALAREKQHQEQLEQFVSDNAQQQENLKQRYAKQLESEKKRQEDYKSQLSHLQQSFAGKSTVNADDADFWDATIELANYEPVTGVSNIKDYKGQNQELYGYKNKAGTLVIGYKYINAFPFYKGVAPACTVNPDVWTLINAKEEVIMRFDKEYCEKNGMNGWKSARIDTFFDGVSIIKIWEGSYSMGRSTGVIDMKGNLIVKCIFQKIDRFQNGVAYAEKLERSESSQLQIEYINGYTFGPDAHFSYSYYKMGLINKQGEWVNTPKSKLYIDAPSLFYYDKIGNTSIHRISWWRTSMTPAKRQELLKNFNTCNAELKKKIEAARAEGMFIDGDIDIRHVTEDGIIIKD